MSSRISRWILKLFGFRVVLQAPLPDKCVIPVVPHTSNWDFPLGLLVRSAIEKQIHFVGKDSLFRGPFGAIFRALGGYPVDRSRRNRFVDAVADIFRREPVFRLSVAPEGTRKRVETLKTGFYYISIAAGVPIVMCRFDYGQRLVEFSKPFYPTDDREADLAFIYDHFRGVRGFRPEYSFQYEN